jgi:hypothetical protein
LRNKQRLSESSSLRWHDTAFIEDGFFA